MVEKIGNVKLDYSKYPGEDYYCDGDVENEILEIVQKHTAEEYEKVIGERKSWPVLYHLSPLRENIVEWLPVRKTDKVLEVGSGCGAITGALARKAGSVTCVDLSKKRSLINAYRHAECDNVTIHVGNFKDIEPDLPKDYDFICLIGVFEYGRGYIGGEQPYIDFLHILKKHLAEGGRIVIAIENKYGMKYFAGATEDHYGTYFSGIENYRQQGTARTFSRNGLEEIFKACGFENSHFYYPYPDYKFMTTLYSDDRLPGLGELSNNIRNFDRDRMVLFDEKAAYDGVLEERLYPVFSNSYLAILGPGSEEIYTRYSNDRAPAFQIKTEILVDSDGKRHVRKYALSEKSKEHVRNMAESYDKLSKRYAGTELAINSCVLGEDAQGVYAEFEYLEGKPLSDLLDECIKRGDLRTFETYFSKFYQLISHNSQSPVSDYDMIFSNFMVDGDTWTLIDYEWTFDVKVDPREQAYRAIYCYMLENDRRIEGLNFDWNKLIRLTEEEKIRVREKELEFQRYVEGGKTSMAILRELIGKRVLKPLQYLEKQISEEDYKRVQIYEDRGNGYSEEQSYFVRNAYTTDETIELKLTVDDQVKRLRIDPAMDAGICKIRRICWNGEKLSLSHPLFLYTNGKLKKGKDEAKEPILIALFPTGDPNLNFIISKRKRKKENTLELTMEMVRVPLSMAKSLAKIVKKVF